MDVADEVNPIYYTNVKYSMINNFFSYETNSNQTAAYDTLNKYAYTKVAAAPKNIHINPKCTGSIHFNTSKYVPASGTNSSVMCMQPTGIQSDKIYYNPRFFSSTQNVLPSSTKPVKAENIHINPLYFTQTSMPSASNQNVNIPNAKSYAVSRARAIHVNRNFLKGKEPKINDINKLQNINLGPSIEETSVNLITDAGDLESSVSNCKYKLINNHSAKDVKLPSENHNKVSKYKYVKKQDSPVTPKSTSLSTIKLKSKYSIRRTPNNIRAKQARGQGSERKMVKHSPSDFKKISNNKLVRKSVLQTLIARRRYAKIPLNTPYKAFSYRKTNTGKRKSIVSTYKVIRSTCFKSNSDKIKNKTLRYKYFRPLNNNDYSNSSGSSSVFKAVSTTKLIRKSILKKLIEARRQVMPTTGKMRLVNSGNSLSRKRTYSRSKLTWRKHSLTSSKGSTKAGKSDLSLLKRLKKKQANSKRQKSKKKIMLLTKKLRKNNEYCAFYNRFGRCKGKEKGTCNKIHDSKYIAICRKLLQGECSSKDCLLSHEVRPEKMPTCHHYLAGLCTRVDCPFLHIKVNPKAPICSSFLQGFCLDVYNVSECVSNCVKRHEYICPVFAEKGVCPKGKSCVYPHRSNTIQSKLLKMDQRPLTGSKSYGTSQKVDGEVSNQKEPHSPLKDGISKSEDSVGNKEPNDKCSNNRPQALFTRYFAMPLSFDSSCDSVAHEKSRDENLI